MKVTISSDTKKGVKIVITDPKEPQNEISDLAFAVQALEKLGSSYLLRENMEVFATEE